MTEIISVEPLFSASAIRDFLSLLVYDPDLKISAIRPQHFEDPIYEEIAVCVLEYRNTYGSCPSIAALESALEAHFQPQNGDSYPQEALTSAVTTLYSLRDLTQDPSLEFFRRRFLEFAKTQRIRQAMKEAEQYLASGQHMQLAQMMVEAASVGEQQQVQTVDLWDFQTWFQQAQRRREGAIMTLFPGLDYYLDGLLGGELITVVAPPSGGKTRFLLSLADSCMQQGKDALVLSVEEEEWKLCMRMAQRILGQSKDQLLASPEDTEARFRERALERGARSTIRFARFTPSSASLLDLQAYYRNDYLSRYRPPGLILVDYADKLAPVHRREHYRLELHDTYLGLFSWAVDLGVPVVTASQTNREGFDRRLITMKDFGEAISKAAISDIVLTLNNSEETPDVTRVYIAKNRGGVAFHSVTLEIDPVTQDLREASGAFE